MNGRNDGKVNSDYAGAGVRSFETNYFCASCSCAKKDRATLWNKTSWKNGTTIPAALQDKIGFVNKRRPGVLGKPMKSKEDE
ncbi:hypothetical protein PF004_g13619 [Phytophthora fragariae]|uniref:Uncharacterized protein n=1 Tax=Phytophthora fragariae TaxID=53985 RepID=A0A6G0NRT7_9STRA|nr:hypothetical protein PF004_g13619 [Phytophthora fragariae]